MAGMERQPEGRIAEVLESADVQAAADVLPLVYEQLRGLARQRMAALPPGQTLQATALVHEAYLRVARRNRDHWHGRWQFFSAAARAMRDILVDQARRKSARKHGGDRRRADMDPAEITANGTGLPTEDVIAVDEALRRLEQTDPRKAEIVMLRFFAGLSREEIAAALDISTRTIDREWRYITAWLHREMTGDARG
jgi:RNA polymerase sigma factor (TIGR02999 family)